MPYRGTFSMGGCRASRRRPVYCARSLTRSRQQSSSPCGGASGWHRRTVSCGRTRWSGPRAPRRTCCASSLPALPPAAGARLWARGTHPVPHIKSHDISHPQLSQPGHVITPPTLGFHSLATTTSATPVLRQCRCTTSNPDVLCSCMVLYKTMVMPV